MHSFFYLDGFTGQIVYEFSFSTLIELFSQRANIDIIIRTVMMALSVTLGATIIGLPVAYYMAKFTTKKNKSHFLFSCNVTFMVKLSCQSLCLEINFSKRRNYQLGFCKASFDMVY